MKIFTTLNPMPMQEVSVTEVGFSIPTEAIFRTLNTEENAVRTSSSTSQL